MIVNVHMLALMEESPLRPVNVPDEQLTGTMNDLDKVYLYGQNDFQPLQFCSVSAGDVIHWNEKPYLVAAMGFQLLTLEQYVKYINTNHRDQYMMRWDLEKQAAI